MGNLRQRYTDEEWEELTKELVVKHEVVSPAMTYTDDSGNVVFTAEYHLKRGSCCTNGCKHCPYNGNEGKL